MSEEKLPEWAKKNPDGEGYVIDIPMLIFSINLHELCIVEILNVENKEGKRRTRDEVIETWKAEIENLRQIKYIEVVRANYYLFFCKKGDKKDTFGDRWRAAHKSTKYLFTVNLEEAWMHITDPLRDTLKIRNESRRAFHKPELNPEEIRVILEDEYKRSQT